MGHNLTGAQLTFNGRKTMVKSGDVVCNGEQLSEERIRQIVREELRVLLSGLKTGLPAEPATIVGFTSGELILFPIAT